MSSLDLTVLLHLSYSIITLFFGLVLFFISSDNRRANLVLGLFLLAISSSVFAHILPFLNLENSILFKEDVFEPFFFVLPLLYFYERVLLIKKIRYWQIAILIPAAINGFLPESGYEVIEFGTLAFYVWLISRSYRRLVRFDNRLLEHYSEVDHMSLRWLKRLILFTLLATILVPMNIVAWTFESIGPIIEKGLEVITYGMHTAILITIIVQAFSNNQIFQSPFPDLLVESMDGEPLWNPETRSGGKFREQNMCSALDRETLINLREIIQKQELFLDPKLSLRRLAIQANLNEKELSRLVNKCADVNFYVFINKFRVERFKHLVQSKKHLDMTIRGLAEESGFSSKSAFYSAFKSIEGTTPSEYIGKHKLSR